MLARLLRFLPSQQSWHANLPLGFLRFWLQTVARKRHERRELLGRRSLGAPFSALSQHFIARLLTCLVGGKTLPGARDYPCIRFQQTGVFKTSGFKHDVYLQGRAFLSSLLGHRVLLDSA